MHLLPDFFLIALQYERPQIEICPPQAIIVLVINGGLASFDKYLRLRLVVDTLASILQHAEPIHQERLVS
jgi:hypothetical protein